MLTAERVIALLGLQPLPLEGGHFHETYRAGELIERACLPQRYTGARLHGSAIYYLLRDDTFSALHRLHSDEVYHFYLGQPVELLLLYLDGHGEVVVLGPDVEAGQCVQLVVPHGVWQGSRLLRSAARGHFALLGTTMAPAYDPADFELGERADLLARYRGHAELIRALTPQ